MRRTTSIHLHAPLDLPRISAALISAAGTETLLDALEELLASGGALPARLYLYDKRAGVYYAAAGFDCAREASDIPMPDDLHPFPEHQYPLRCEHIDVGLLEVLAPGAHDVKGVALIASVLAPALIAIDRLDRGHRELHQLRQEVRLLTGAGELLRHVELDVLLTKVLEAAMGAVRAEVGALLAKTSDGRRLVCWGLREDHVAAIRLRDGSSLVDVVAESDRSICLDADDVAEQLDVSALEAKLSGLLALPLVVGERTHGALLLANPEAAFGDGERRLAETVAGMAAVAIDNALLVKATVEGERLKRELDLARSVQESMWPVPRLAVGRLAIAGASRPCNETGGDYYTYRERDGRLIAAIADVSGHGLGAALYTTTAHALLQQQLRAGANVVDSARMLNDGLVDANSGRFMTAALVEIDAATLAMRYASAGHNPLLWIGAHGARWLPSCTMPLGIEPDFTHPPPPEATLAPGDLLLLYTDGVVEAFDPQDEPFGTRRLAEIAQACVAERVAPQAVVARIFAACERWAAGVPWHDDLTLVAISVGGA